MRFSFRNKTMSRIGHAPSSFHQNSVTLGNEKAGHPSRSASSSFPCPPLSAHRDHPGRPVLSHTGG